MDDKLFANVIIDVTHEALNKPFVYLVPNELKDKIKIGDKVVVPFGKSNKQIEGFIIQILNENKFLNSDSYKNDTFFKNKNRFDDIKYILGLAEKKISINYVLLNIAKFMSDEYATIFSKCLKTVLPVKRIINKNKKQTDAIIKYETDFDDKNIILTKEQTKIIDSIKISIDKNIYSSHLLFGVTGSGKTEVYLNLIKYILDKGKNVIVLIPEISLTYQTMSRLKSRFGEKVAIIHSKMSDGDKYIQIKKCIDGECSILVGPRSAIFAPFENLGLIVIDEEDDDSYKSELTPRYDARDIAEFRGELQNAVVLRLSATPSVSTFYKANCGIINLHTLKERAGDKVNLPKVSIVDMRREFKYGNKTVFSKLLYDKIREKLEKKEQILLFLNKRGLSRSLTCMDCGHVIKCPHCDVPLTLHNDSTIKCHYCGYEEREPMICPNCNSEKLNSFGMGTQKLEEQIIKTFNGARVLRMDRDTTNNKDGYEKIIKSFKNKEADILIGTQMVAKGHDFDNLTLVGIMCADMSFNIQNYKATEKAFDLLVQVAGRSGRKKNGDCIIQSYNIEGYPLDDVVNNDYKNFYEKEILFRKEFLYPPIYKMLVCYLKSKDASYLIEISKNLKKNLDMNYNDVSVLGPTKPVVGKISDYYYYLFYIKCKNIDRAKEIRFHFNDMLIKLDKMKFITVLYDIEG